MSSFSLLVKMKKSDFVSTIYRYTFYSIHVSSILSKYGGGAYTIHHIRAQIIKAISCYSPNYLKSGGNVVFHEKRFL
jgi:hypothetical protein